MRFTNLTTVGVAAIAVLTAHADGWTPRGGGLRVDTARR
jgi:hypothetical protein